MKTLRKPLALLLVCLAVSYISQDANASAIIDEDQTGTIHIYKYAVDNLNNYNTPATGEQQTITDLDAIPNIKFTITRVQDDVDTVENAQALTGDDAYSNEGTTNEYGILTFTDLPLGNYLIHEVDNDAVQAPVDDFLVSIPMTNAAGTEWIYEIYIYPKNELVSAPDVDIFISELDNKYDSLKLESEVNWFITSGIPAGIARASEYQLAVALDSYLPLINNSVTLYHIGAADNRTNLTAEHFTTEPTDTGFNITLTEAGRTFLADTVTNNGGVANLYSQFKTGFTIPSGDLPDALGTDVSADVQLNYTSEVNLKSTSDSTGAASVYAGGISLLKVNGRTPAETLAGAVFQIYPSLEAARRGEDAVTAPGGSTAWTATTIGDGTAAFYGLSYGGIGAAPTEGSTTYYLVETQAPDGYNLLRAPEAVTVDAASHQNPVTISNYTGFTLPITGGSGTVIITLAGLLLIILALTLYLVAQKRRHEI